MKATPIHKNLVFLFGIIVLTVLNIAQCNEPEGPNCDIYYCDPECSNRTGAICNDGTISSSIGSGTCSHHGGVKSWICDTI